MQTTGALIADGLTGRYSGSSLIFASGSAAQASQSFDVQILMAAGGGTSASISATLADAATVVDWSALKPSLRPAGLSDAAWDHTFTNFVNSVGTTIGSLTTELARDAGVFHSFGITSDSGSALLAFELEQAGDFGSLAARSTSGSVGAGWTSIADLGLSVAADGSVTFKGAADLNGLFSLSVGGLATYTLSASVDRSVDLNGNILSGAASLPPVFFRQPDGSYSASGGYTLNKTATGFDLTRSDGTVLNFDSAGHVLSATSASGQHIDATVDATGKPLTFTASNGASLSLTRDAAGHVTQATDSDGGNIALSYSADGKQLTGTTGTAGNTAFAYTASGDLSTVDRGGTAHRQLHL
ncbi:hypothetical protein E6W36_15120 [Hankyongella ginsenosidimutans]|uniref:RHS repeat protein n=1 Tax=Hankyongella ginsenosidimutans TaxID=1763828 RepID=A0A4D7C815_9SPHN|nr:hypothetical protein [Hankyongella ginsenosidimutans]QCI80360.1 hypothetical protein E6W36_15120 [Hankyongella ginsenosidimutans]